jgi:hypothetical protein
MKNDLSVPNQNQKEKVAIITVPEILFLVAAFISFILSVSLWFLSNKEQGLFVGIWVPSIISLGCFFQNMVMRHQGNKSS